MTLNQDWFTEVTRDSRADKVRWVVLATAIDRWLGYSSKAPDHRLRMYPRHDGDKLEEKIRNRTTEIQAALDALSPIEADFFKEMTIAF